MNVSNHQLLIACSVYNPNADLEKTVDSVLGQTFKDFLFILNDDYSTEFNVINKLKSKYAQETRIKFTCNSQNEGLTSSLIRIVENFPSEYIARIDSGDTWYPNKLTKQIEYLKANRDCIIIGSQCNYIDENERVIGVSNFKCNDNQIREVIKTRQGIYEHSSIIFRNVANYRNQFTYAQDLDLYLRLSNKGKMYCLNEVLLRCKVNTNGITVQKRYLQMQYQSEAYRHYNLGNKIQQDINIYDSKIRKIVWGLAAPFYAKYIKTRTKNANNLTQYVYLMIVIFLYPPILHDYARKIYLKFYNLLKI